MSATRIGRWAGLGALLVVAACGSSDDTSSSDDQLAQGKTISPAEAQACATGSVVKNALGQSVLACTKPFDTAPLVRLPADAPDGTKFYGAFTMPSDSTRVAVIWNRKGDRFVAVGSDGAALRFDDGANLPKALHAPTNRATFTIYEFDGTLGASIASPYGPATAITLTGARPVVELDGQVIDGHMVGVLDGTVSQRLTTPIGSGPFAQAFDENTRLPIHITTTLGPRSQNLQDWTGATRINDATTYTVEGTIDNFSQDVTEGSKTYPSLSALGANNPFLGAKDGTVQLFRLGNMHGIGGDAHWVLSYPVGSQSLTLNGMSFTLTAFTAPTYLFDAGVAPDALSKVDIRPHIPFSSNGHSVVLAPLAASPTK